MKLRSYKERFWSKLPSELKLAIAEFLPQSALSRLVQVDKDSKILLRDLLYRRDAEQNGSSAILWAAGKSMNDKYRQTAHRVLALSVRNGGDVNVDHDERDQERPSYGGARFCTALHLAAALGSATFVSLLLEAGADTNAWGCIPDIVEKEVDRTMRERFSPKLRIFGTAYNPLFCPMVLGHEDVVRLLLEAYAPGDLAFERVQGQKDTYMTILHLIAARRETTEEQAWYEEYLFSEGFLAMNEPLPGGYTALYLAIDSTNPFAFDALVSNGADLDAGSIKTPLVRACELLATGRGDAEYFRWLAQCITELIENGADVNTLSDFEPETPLIAVCSLPPKADVPLQLWQEVVFTLLDNDAEVHHSFSYQRSALKLVYLSMKGSSVASEEKELVFKKLIEKGARINCLMYEDTSLLGHCIGIPPKGPPHLLDFLVSQGAELVTGGDEVDSVLLDWIDGPLLHGPTDFNMMHYKQHFSKDAIKYAFKQSYTGFSNPRFDAMRAHFEDKMPGAAMLNEAMSRKPVRLDVLPFIPPFDPNGRDDWGRGLLHTVVDLALGPKRAGPQVVGVATSIANAKFLIDRGVSTLMKRGDETIRDMLKDAPKKVERLRSFLMKRYEEELKEKEKEEASDEAVAYYTEMLNAAAYPSPEPA